MSSLSGALVVASCREMMRAHVLLHLRKAFDNALAQEPDRENLLEGLLQVWGPFRAI